MGYIVPKQQDKNTDLNNRITADLRLRATEASKMTDPDFVEDSNYTKNLKTTGKFSWFWIILVLFSIIGLLFILF